MSTTEQIDTGNWRIQIYEKTRGKFVELRLLPNFHRTKKNAYIIDRQRVKPNNNDRGTHDALKTQMPTTAETQANAIRPQKHSSRNQ